MSDPILLISNAGTNADMQLALAACALLDKHYPGKGNIGHGWMVTVENGSMMVRCGAFRGNWCYHILLDQHDGPALSREIVRGAGEMLERNRVARSARTESTYNDKWFGFLPSATRDA